MGKSAWEKYDKRVTSTRHSIKRFQKFCARARLLDFPTNQRPLVVFLDRLFTEGASLATAKVYTAAVANRHVENGHQSRVGPSVILALQGYK